jgi:hypothetical protein
MKKIFTSGALGLLTIALTAQADSHKVDQATYDKMTPEQKEANDQAFIESDDVSPADDN